MVSLKLNSSDFQKGGYSLEDCMEVVKYLNGESIDMLELSGGTYEQPQLLGHHGDSSQSEIPKRQSTVLREAYFAEYAKQVRTISKMPLMVTGGFEHTAVMNEALKEVDLIGVARPFCVQADWPNLLQSGSITCLPRMENQLVGKGKLGPASPYKLIQVINIQGEVAWFYYQILQLSDKNPVKLKKKLITALLFHLIREQWLASKRRALLRKGKK